MNLHPWEFGEYTLGEFVMKLRGFTEGDIAQWKRAAFIGLLAVSPNMKRNDRIAIWELVPPEYREKKEKQPMSLERLQQIKKLITSKGFNNGG